MTDQDVNRNGKKTVVVTGAGGFVGQYLIQELWREWPGVKLVAWDRIELMGKGWDGAIQTAVVDITEPDTFKDFVKRLQPDWIVHLAALALVGESFKKKELYAAVNVEGTRRLLEVVAQASPATRILAISSADVYGLAAKEYSCPLPELALSECRPANPYAESKLAMEEMIHANYREQCIVVRPFPHIGPGQARGFVMADFASQIAEAEVGQGEAVIRVGNLTAQRDFTDVRDVVKAYRLLMESGKLGETYNVGSGKAVSIRQILDELLALSSAKVVVRQDPELVRPVEVPCVVGDCHRLEKAVGWKPVIELDQTLREIMEDWRERIKASGKAGIG